MANTYITRLTLNGKLYDIRDAAAYRALQILNGDSSTTGSIAKMIKDAVENVKSTSFQRVDTVPSAEDAEDGIIYLVPEPGQNNSFIEFVKVLDANGNPVMEQLGTTNIDLSGYVTKEATADLAEKLLVANGFAVTEDITERDGCTYATLSEDGKVTLGIAQSGTVYSRENIVHQSELDELKTQVNDLSTAAQQVHSELSKKIDDEIVKLNQQTGMASYVTVRMESENVGIVDIVDTTVLQPANTRIIANTDWFNPSLQSFTLSEPEQILGLAELVNNDENAFAGKTIKLDGDIDMLGQEFQPIGTVELQNPKQVIYNVTDVGGKLFSGTFDGEGHVIRNLRITADASDAKDWSNSGIGLFSMLGNGATIKNVTIENVEIDVPDAAMVGAVVGYIPKTTGTAPVTTIENCKVTGTVNIKGNIGIGGIIGRAENGTNLVMKNCLVDGTSSAVSRIEATYPNLFAGVGGLAGCVYGHVDNVVENCTVKNVTITAPDEGNGGLVGHFEKGTIKGCTVENVVVADTMDTNIYMQEAVVVGALVGCIDGTIRATTAPFTSIQLEDNTITNVAIEIPATYTNSGNAAGVALDTNGTPDWECWPVIGTPRNTEAKDPTPFISSNQTWAELKDGITVRKVSA